MGKFVIERRQGELREEVASFANNADADYYIEQLGQKGSHVDLFVVDKGKNLIAEGASPMDLQAIRDQVEAQKLRGEAIRLRAENDAAEAKLKGEVKAS